MRPRKVSTRAIDRLKDEVYRQMLRLEAERPAARIHLAVALLNAWTALEKQSPEGEPRQWLRKLSPICLRMIQAALTPAIRNHCLPLVFGPGRFFSLSGTGFPGEVLNMTNPENTLLFLRAIEMGESNADWIR